MLLNAKYSKLWLSLIFRYEEANEKVINMEGLVNLNNGGGIVKDLEMKVATYKCQLSVAAEEKVETFRR